MKETEIIKLERCFLERFGDTVRVYLYDFTDYEAAGRILAKTLCPDELYGLYRWAKEIFQNINKNKDCYNCLKWNSCRQLEGDERKFKYECRKEGYKYWYPKYEL
jgi:hypothetical protein